MTDDTYGTITIDEEPERDIHEVKPLLHKTDEESSSSDNEISIETGETSIQQKGNVEDFEVPIKNEKLVLEHEDPTLPHYNHRLKHVLGEYPKESRGVKPKPPEEEEEEEKPKSRYCAGRRIKKFLILCPVKVVNGCFISCELVSVIIFWILFFVLNPDASHLTNILYSLFFGFNVVLSIFGFLTNVIYFCVVTAIGRVCLKEYYFAGIGVLFGVPILILSTLITCLELTIVCTDLNYLRKKIPFKKIFKKVFNIDSYMFWERKKETKLEKKLKEDKQNLEVELQEWKMKHYEQEEKRLQLEALRGAIIKIESERKKKKRKVKPGEYLYGEELRILREMGFRKDQTMKLLLEKHNGDLNRVIGEFL